MITKSIDKLFNEGNYTAVALAKDPEEWQTYAAFGLVGKAKQAIEGLQNFNNTEAGFYSAVASWIDGDDERAGYLLKNIHTPYAQNLLSLIQKPQINILAQIGWTRGGPHWDILTGGSYDKKFNIQNISFHPDDLQNKPYANIHQYYNPNSPPDFYLCQIGWGAIAPNLQELSCPIIGQSGDHDMHIQNFYPWYQLFDQFIVNDPTEWQDISALVKVPVSTFPKTHGIALSTPAIPNQNREIDLFLSGMWGHPYHPDKISIVHQVLPSLNEYKVFLLNGYLSSNDYYKLLGNSKVSFTYVRFPQGLPMRGLDTIAMGCALVAQKGCVITLFLGEEEGVVTYDTESNALLPAIHKVLKEWPKFERRAQRGAEIIRKEFALPRLASQYLRFAAFLAAKPRSERQKKPTEDLTYKRMSVLCDSLTPEDILADHTILRLQNRLRKEQRPHIFIDLARTSIMEYTRHYVAVNDDDEEDQNSLFNDAQEIYKTGMAQFPKSLVLRFNFIRTLFHFGKPKDIDQALALAKEALDMPLLNWQIDFMEDLFPHDFWHTFFNYRGYFDLIMKHFKEGIDISQELLQLILASLHYYIGKQLNDLNHLEQAVLLDPEFPCYSLSYARQLVRLGNKPEDCWEAGRLLLKLAKSSMFFVEAYEILKHLQDNQLFLSPEFKELAPQIERSILNYTEITEAFSIGTLERINLLKKASNITVVKHQTKKKDVHVSIIMPVFKQLAFAQQCISRLKLLTGGVNYELILIDDGTFIDNHTYLASDNHMELLQSPSSVAFFKAYNEGASAAQGKYIVFMPPNAVPQEGWLKALLDDADANPLTGIIGSKLVTVDGTIYHAGMVYSRLYNGPGFAYIGTESNLKAANYRRELQGVSITGMLVRRDLFLAAGGFDERYLASCGDFDLCLKIRELGSQVVYQPAGTLYHLPPEKVSYPVNPWEDLNRFHKKWDHKFLEDGDLFYFVDGYALKSDPIKSPGDAVLKPFRTNQEKAQWAIVTAVQTVAQGSGIQAARPFLLKVDSWPLDIGILEWGAKMCEQAGIPEQAEAFQQKINNCHHQ